MQRRVSVGLGSPHACESFLRTDTREYVLIGTVNPWYIGREVAVTGELGEGSRVCMQGEPYESPRL